MKKLLFLLLFLSITKLYAEQIPYYMDGLKGLWHLNEGAGAATYDALGVNSGVLYGGLDAEGWVSGKYSYAINFPNDNVIARYIQISNNNNINITGNQITVMGWFYYTGAGEANYKNGIRKDAQYLLFWSIGANDLTYFWYLGDVTGGALAPTKSDSWFRNKWTHIVGTYDGSKMKIYLNGELDNEKNASGNIGSSTYNLLIGNGPTPEKNYNFFGIIDEVAIFNRALTIGEIQKIYRATRGKYEVN